MSKVKVVGETYLNLQDLQQVFRGEDLIGALVLEPGDLQLGIADAVDISGQGTVRLRNAVLDQAVADG